MEDLSTIYEFPWKISLKFRVKIKKSGLRPKGSLSFSLNCNKTIQINIFIGRIRDHNSYFRITLHRLTPLLMPFPRSLHVFEIFILKLHFTYFAFLSRESWKKIVKIQPLLGVLEKYL